MTTKPPELIRLFGRRMKRIRNGWELRSGQVRFVCETFADDWDAEIWIDSDLVSFAPCASLDAALARLIRMRNRLVKSLTPEGR